MVMKEVGKRKMGGLGLSLSMLCPGESWEKS